MTPIEAMLIRLENYKTEIFKLDKDTKRIVRVFDHTTSKENGMSDELKIDLFEVINIAFYNQEKKYHRLSAAIAADDMNMLPGGCDT